MIRLHLVAAMFSTVMLAVSVASAQPDIEPQWILPAIRAPRVEHHTFDSAAAQSKVSCFVYTPEAYDTEKQRRFPVVYWLHGSGGGTAGVS